MKDKIVCVEWDDAGFNSGYYDKKNKDIHSPIIVRTVGYLIMKNKSVVITSTDRYKYGGEVNFETLAAEEVRRIIIIE